MARFIFTLIVFLLFVWRIKKGFANGIMEEIVNIISGVVSLLCAALILFAVTSVRVKAMGTLTLCIIALVLLGILFKICSLIFSPLLALSNISLLEGFNKMLGAAMGVLEACILSGLLYFVLDYIGIYVF